MQAVIEFGLDGTVLKANDNFLGLFGYTLEELKGQHHMLLVAPEHRDSDAYRGYFDAMARGETSVAQQKRVAKGGSEVVMQGARSAERRVGTECVSTCSSGWSQNN